ncbi:MAG: cytidine deaminase [Ignavibacteriae bacterium]|nr:cytidine deaminase [Ignavibacteriota bacterium]
MNYSELLQIAKKVKSKAYCSYSNFHVGAALLTDDGDVYTGVNVENSSYSLTICAERVAVFKAISEGKRNFKAIALTSDSEKVITPCGACRQVLSEFGNKDFEVVMMNNSDEIRIMKLEELLPHSFDKDYL